MLTLEAVVIERGDFALRADMQFGPGITAVIGPSGAGKSTVLDVIAGFLTPQAGRVLWDGRDITEDPPGARPCGVVFQDNNLFPHLTVAGNLALAVQGPKGETAHKIAAALQDVALPGLEDRKPAALSGGQQARIALARVLLQERPVLLLDEAFGAFGPALKADMLDLVAKTAQARKLQVIMVSHNPQDAARIADHTAVVADGQVFAPVPTGPLLADPPPALRGYLGRGVDR